MINKITIVNPENNRYYETELYEKTLIYSTKNNHGKTVIIKSIMYCLGANETMSIKEDGLDFKKLFISLKINEKYFVRYNDKYYVQKTTHDYSNIPLQKKEYIKLILDELGFFDEIPYIKTKNNKYTNSYIESILTYCYIDSDKHGDPNQQFKNQMFTKNNMQNYFYLISNWDDEYIKLNNDFAIKFNSSNLSILNDDKNTKEHINNTLNDVIEIIKTNNLDFYQIESLKKINDKLKENYKNYYDIVNKINNNNLIIDFCDKYNKINDIDNLLDEEIEYYVDIDGQKRYIKVKLADFAKKYIYKKFANQFELDKIKHLKEEDNRILIKQREECLSLINEIKKTNEYKTVMQKNIVLSEEFLKIAFEKDVKALEDVKNEIIKFTDDIKNYDKKLKDYYKKCKKEYEFEFEYFCKNNNWVGSTNSSIYKDFFFRYFYLKSNKKYVNFPLIIDEFEKLAIDMIKINLIFNEEESKNTQFIFSSKCDQHELETVFSKFILVELSDDKYNGNLLYYDFRSYNKNNEIYKLYMLITEKGNN